MCRLLQVSRSGFYAWQRRPPSAREMANRRLSKEIRTIHHEVNGIYGHRRIKAELAAMGHVCGRHRVARLMREAGLRVRSRKTLAAGFQQSSCSADCPESPGSSVRLGSRQPALGLGHDLRADGPRLAVSGSRARSFIHALSSVGRCTIGCSRPWYTPRWRWPWLADSRKPRYCCTRIVQPILRVRLPGLAAATSHQAQPFTSGTLLGQRRNGELLSFAEG